MELPPRARRIPDGLLWRGVDYGTTSACAENTTRLCGILLLSRNYLRVRGEYATTKFVESCCLELPPRARRIPRQPGKILSRSGTTSACAENTTCVGLTWGVGWNYLRVRGEYPTAPHH